MQNWKNGLGIDSVKRVEIIVALGEEFGLDLMTQSDAPSNRTIADLANWIGGLLKKSGESALPAQHPNEEKVIPVQTEVISGVHSPSMSQAVPAPHYTNDVRRMEPRITSAVPSTDARPLSGRVALVTGSGRGVGRTIVRLLAKRGATVIVNSFHSRELGEQTAAEINAEGGRAVHIWGSVANPDHVDEMFREIDRQFGLDILVCNASDGRIGSFLELTPEDWDRAFRTNVSGHHRCAVRAAELMRPRGGGSIVTMSRGGRASIR